MKEARRERSPQLCLETAANWETQLARSLTLCLSPSVFVLQRNPSSPFLVHHVASGLRQLRQVGQQRTQVVELCCLVVIFSTKDLHQLSQTRPLLEDLKPQRRSLSLMVQHREEGSPAGLVLTP